MLDSFESIIFCCKKLQTNSRLSALSVSSCFKDFFRLKEWNHFYRNQKGWPTIVHSMECGSKRWPFTKSFTATLLQLRRQISNTWLVCPLLHYRSRRYLLWYWTEKWLLLSFFDFIELWRIELCQFTARSSNLCLKSYKSTLTRFNFK